MENKEHNIPLSEQFEADEDGFVSFGDVARGLLDQQSQYASRYVEGILDYPNLGEGLNFRGSADDYHALRIHKNDIEEFVVRVKQHKSE